MKFNEQFQGARAGTVQREVMTEAEAPLLAEEPRALEPRSKRPSRSDRRQVLLSEEPVLLGSSWAQVWCKSMQSDGRLVVGGWPGTLAEARARIQGHLGGELARRRMPALSVEELTVATSATYQQAKKDWLIAARDMRPKGARNGDDHDEDDE
jgi:hypothetical protein